MDDSDGASGSNLKEKIAKCQNSHQPGDKIQLSVESMKNQMKITDEEKKYRAENFDEKLIKDHAKYFKCTKCGVSFQNKINKGRKVCVHPLLNVLMCASCSEYYGDGNFSLDSDGEDKYCRWCGEGGTLFSCSKCICAFCNKCIKKHFEEVGLQKVQNDDDWICYFCNPKPLWYLRSICSLAQEMATKKKEELDKKRESKVTSKKKGKLVKENLGSKDNTSENLSSDDSNQNRKKKKKKKFRKMTRLSYKTCESCSEAEVGRIKTRAQKFNKTKHSNVSGRDSTSSESTIPKKKSKLLTETSVESLPSKVEKAEAKLEKNKCIVIDKLKGIWKITQIVTEIGLNSSNERLESLSNPENLTSLENLSKEYEKLKSVTTMLSSSITKVCNSVDALKDDLSCENVKDDRDVFKSEAAKIKSLAINLLKKSDEKSSGHDLLPLNVSEVESKESSKKEDKSKSSSEDSEREMAEISNNEIDQSQSLFSGSEEGSKSESSNENKIEGENNKSEQKKIKNKNTRFCKEESEENVKETNEVNTGAVAKPLLKVKSFARMTDDNVFSPLKTNTLNGISENNESEQNSETNIKEQDKCDEKVKKKQVDEYNVETDGSSNEEIRLTRKHKSKKKNDLGSNVSDDSSENQHSKRKVKNRKLKETFQRFREKRKQFFKSSSQNDKSVENTQKINQSESSNVLESSEDENDKLRKRSRRRAVRNKIESSEEENVASKSETKISDSESGQNVEETSDSDASSNSEFERSKKKKSTWRRIVKRKARDESSEEKEEDKKKGRKNIKKILKKDSLKVETKEALKNEEERKKRLEERNKLLRELFPENANEENEKDNPKQLILDFDVETKEPLVTVHKKLMSKLKPHQIKGVKFMWDNCFESIKRLEEDSGSGCILAHCMGLGKTLQVVTLIHTTMTHDLGVNTVLIVCPLSIVSNWIKEFEMWLSDIHTESIILYDLLKSKKNEERSFNLEEWHKTGGVMVLSYDLFRNLTKPPTSRLKKKKVYQTFEQTLLDPGPDIVICDEGHLLKNEDTALSKRINQIKTSRRIVLTGTPLQNNLIEYHCMVQFVKPNILGTRKEFMNRFVNPINNGQFEDSTEHDVKVMKRRSHVLHSLLSNCVQRFDYSVLTPFLPEKHEYVLSIALTNVQAKAYQYFINNLSAKASGSSKTATLFHDYHNLQRIWTHPRVIHAHAEREHEKMLEEEDSEGSLKNFVVDSEEEESTSSSPSGSDNSVVEVSNGKRTLRSNAKDKECEEIVEEVEIESNRQRQWWNEFFRDDDLKDIRASNKLIILFSLLKYCTEIEEKVLVFSQSLFSLDLIEHFLCRVDENSDRGDELLAGFNDSWVPGVDYFRLDGTTSSDLRTRWCENFNKNSNKRARLFLISTRAGGLGINLHAANRVVVFDASWNPSHDLQSIFRVYRFGQKKTCYVYRFLAEATMEEKIYERQVTKLSLAHRVVDEHQIERHYSMMNLQELYRYEPTPPENRKTPKLPKDKVLADLLATYKEIIVRYHEHDSLLENQEEEELTEEERKAAWQEFEEEKVQKATAMPLGLLNYQNQLAVMDALKSPQATFPSSVIQGAIRPEALAALRTMVSTGSMPLSIIHRGLRLGLTPLINESVDSFLTRVNNRELLLGNFPRET